MAKIRRSDLAPQEPPAAPHAALYDQDNDTDFAPTAPAAPEKKRGSLAYTLAMLFFGVVFLVSAGLLVKRFADDRRTENEFAELQSMIDTAAAPQPSGESVNPNGAKFSALRDKNSDFIGWLSIDGTELDFPVMYAPNNKDFYLRHDFDKSYSVYGVPYLDENTTLGANAESDNLVIYGHNMKNGSMFKDINRYKDPEYFKEHQYFSIYTPEREIRLKAVSCYYGEAKPIVRMTGFKTQETFDEFVRTMVEPCSYKEEVEYPARSIFTLVTCSYEINDARTFLFAVEVDEEGDQIPMDEEYKEKMETVLEKKLKASENISDENGK